MYDVSIIGAGVIGGMIARTLSKYNLRICILEKENDVATGATKANSAIVHAGFDAKEGTLKAKLNVRGSEIMESIAHDLGVKYEKNGSLVIGFSDMDRITLTELLKRGRNNGVRDLRILDYDELHSLEPNLSPDVCCALYAPTGAIICPYELAIAAVGNAMDNGAELFCNFEVSNIEKFEEGYIISSADATIKTKYIINCAGINADKIANMTGDFSFNIHPRKGEYILLDKDCGDTVSHTIFRTPSEMGKGILITPTVDGNLLAGPTSVDMEDKDDNSTTARGFEKIIKEARENVPSVAFNKTITSFCGLRAVGNTGDFIINSPTNGFINVAGIESPGLSASPAIAEYVEKMLCDMGLTLTEKNNYIKTRKPMHYFRDATIEEKNAIIKKDRRFGKVICRCEGITEGEIIEAITTNPKATNLDGVKRRTRAQMGRCQGGFCSPYIVELIARENNIAFEKVTKSGNGSYINLTKTKEAE